MSQMPPSPYGNPSPQFSGGYPPAGRTSGTAIASLVLGILGVCPLILIGGLIATVLGIVGIVATGKPGVRGRGLAITGLILGILSVLAWGGVAGMFGVAYQATAVDRATARSFLTHVSNGDATAAATECVPGTTPESIQAEVDALKPVGKLTDSTFMSFKVNSNNGNTTSVVGGSATFGSTPKGVTFTLVPAPGGKRLIKEWQIK